MNDEFEDFLNAGSPAEEAPAAPSATSEPPQEPAAKADAAPAAPEPDDDEPDPASLVSPEGKIPVAALQAERAQRKDWKEKALRYEGEMAAIKAQLEELKKAPPPPQAQQPQHVPGMPPEMPNPAVDPQGFQLYQAQVQLNQTLNMSEAIVRQELGDEAVDKALVTFKEEAAKNPQLQMELRRQAHPYKFVVATAKKIEALKEIGEDPAAFRARVEAEVRAKLEAEMGEQGQQAAPQAPAAPRLPGSLATARSAQARSAPAWSGPTPLENLFPQL